jgi:hypothetical protein
MCSLLFEPEVLGLEDNFITAATYLKSLTEQGRRDKVAADQGRWSFRLGLLPVLT